jgi:hypothetical protein
MEIAIPGIIVNVKGTVLKLGNTKWGFNGKHKHKTQKLNYTRAIRKVHSGDPVTKQAKRKNVLYTRNTYIFKLLLNVVSA